MQIDFHHGTTYCIARLAGFDRAAAAVIAHAAQYVDDAIEAGAVRFDNGQVFQQINSAHRTLDYRNFQQLANSQVWIPFHFLPGNDGQPSGHHTSQRAIDRAICHPNSHVAQDMMRECIRQRHQPHALHRLGVAAHVFVDTWAHQGFVGLNHPINQASDLLDDQGQIDPEKQARVAQFFGSQDSLLDRVKGALIGKVLPLGHGAVLSYPDKPFLRWGYTNGLHQVVRRDNPADFWAAAQELCIWFQRYLRGHELAAPPGLIGADRECLGQMLTEIVDWSGSERHERWLEAIGQGRFSFGPEVVTYQPESWVKAALGTAQPNFEDPRQVYPWTMAFANSHWRYFHDALAAHQNFVMERLLPSYGIDLVAEAKASPAP
jgi:hypothetical protein